MKTIHAVWELENIGADAWEIWLDAADTTEMLAQEEERIIAQGAEYIVVKTPPNCKQLIFGIPQMGYTFVEQVFHVAVRRDEYNMPETIARFDRGLTVVEYTQKEDLERICGIICKGIFVSDRISLDPAFGVLKGGNRYANWLRGLVAGGGHLYEVLKGEKPIGFFVICRKDENTVDPVLMGMYDEQNDRGMGALLHKKTLDTCFTFECKRLTSTIVSNNTKVLSVYVNAGASITDTLYTYVKHVK